jgi:hypothetical protein
MPRGAHTGKMSGKVSEDGKTRISSNGTRWGATLQTAVKMWPTPTVDNSANVNPKDNRFRCLVRAVNESVMWPTPSANEDAAGTPKGNMQKMLGNHPGIRGTTPEEWQLGSLNPAWVAWLMGYPTEWLNLKDWAMPSSRKSHTKSSKR